jgi:AAA family ATP:ADP antiporter
MATTENPNRLLARFFRLFGKVEAEEVVGVSVATLTVFLLLTAYYLLKTAREPLILLGGGAEVKSYASAGQSALLLLVAWAYGTVAKRTGRMKLIATVYLFFVACLVLFAVLAMAKAPIGVVFYLWVGVFNVTAIAQFWSFAADIYTQEQGKRLFAILGIGSSVGAIAGSAIAKGLVPLGPAGLMITAAGILGVCVGLFAWMNKKFDATTGDEKDAKKKDEPFAKEQAFTLLFRDKYLLLIAASLLLLNWVNSNGEYMLDRTLLATVHDMAPDAKEKFVGAFKADYFTYFNVLGMLLQLFAVSRIIRVLGVGKALLLLPAASAIAYTTLLFNPALQIVRAAKVLENGIDYSVQNTTQQTLYLATSRVEKYVGKSLVDTLFVRLGDVMSAVAVLIGTTLSLPIFAFAALNLCLIAVWVVVLLMIGKENTRRSDEPAEQLAKEPLGREVMGREPLPS